MPKFYYIGTHREVAHHAAPLSSIGMKVAEPTEALRIAETGDICLFYNEFFSHFRTACEELNSRRCGTLYVIDGILEWRSLWDFPGHLACLWANRPVIGHKIACIGRAQARLLESWGNLGKCEIVGLPRLDHLIGRKPRVRQPDEPFRLLIMTAKSPSFNDEQRICILRGLCDLRDTLEQINSSADRPTIEPIWRITAGLAEEIGVENALRDTIGADLSTILESIDAVITSPSTSMLESMLQGVPVAILDYNNCPHYVPAAWTITARQHFDSVLRELQSPSPAKMLYQQTILHDNLECRTPATPRLLNLVTEMAGIAAECIQRKTPLVFPRRMLVDGQDGHHIPEEEFQLERLFPDHPVFSNMDRALLQISLGHANVELEHTKTQLTLTKDSLAKTVRELQLTQDSLMHSADELQATKNAVEHTVRELKLTRGSLTHTVRELELTRGSLTHTVRELELTRDSLTHTVRELELTRDSLTPTINELEATRIAYEQAISESANKSRAFAATHRELQQAKGDFEESQKEVIRIQTEAEQALLAFQSSTSLRIGLAITSPFRAIRRIWKNPTSRDLR
ncbi:MAG: hypothetical protein SGI77_05410 [Pirellulaceae bacterium]|nr:hypothetical protein [Pirellulaceae bacterium]